MSDDLSNALLGQPVEISEISKGLKKLWEGNDASTNASLMNFLIYSEDPSILVKNSERIQRLTQEHACRAVLIAMDREAPEASAQAWVTAHCHLAHGKKSICSEQIAFLLRGKALGRLRNTVFAHLNSDLPLVLWWQGDLSDLFEERLYRLIDRLLVDSSAWRDPAKGFQDLTEATENSGKSLIVQDLSWTRSYHFRLALAGLFDDPAASKAFPEINEVRITAHTDQKTSAKMLLAWLIVQAGWKVVKNGKEQFELCSKDGQKIDVTLNYSSEVASISSLELKAPGFSLSLNREQGNQHLAQAICTDGHCLYFSGPADAEASEELVASQLSRGGKNSLLMRIMPQFLEIL